jgi:hypothetical protein
MSAKTTSMPSIRALAQRLVTGMKVQRPRRNGC